MASISHILESPLLHRFVDSNNGKVVLGRIVVHDRITVEAKVLPRYFNHSSFASLRRQLNYFSFVRLGKGRQRESTYTNENVMELDDILLLKRRLAGTPKETGHTTTQTSRPTKRRRVVASSPRAPSPVGHCISEDEEPAERDAAVVSANNSVSNDSKSSTIALDLTQPDDEEVMAGCTALLQLAQGLM